MTDYDAQIRRVLLPHLRARARWVCEEFHCDGRVDVATLEEDTLCGYEIKAARDSLDRLFSPRLGPMSQARAYSRCLERVTVVAAPVHVAPLLERMPAWWGLLAVEGAALRVVREGQTNPKDVTHRLAWMMWAPEVRALLKVHGLAQGARARHELHARMMRLPRTVIRAAVFDALVHREWGPQRTRKPTVTLPEPA